MGQAAAGCSSNEWMLREHAKSVTHTLQGHATAAGKEKVHMLTGNGIGSATETR